MKKYKLPNIPEKEQTPRIKSLLLLLEKAYVHQQEQEGKITCLKNEIAILKGEKKRPVFKGSKLDKDKNGNNKS